MSTEERVCDCCEKSFTLEKNGQHTGWWFMRNYWTKLGNVYNGSFCPKCSKKVYSENLVAKKPKK